MNRELDAKVAGLFGSRGYHLSGVARAFTSDAELCEMVKAWLNAGDKAKGRPACVIELVRWERGHTEVKLTDGDRRIYCKASATSEQEAVALAAAEFAVSYAENPHARPV
jgi:hypothetical protein